MPGFTRSGPFSPPTTSEISEAIQLSALDGRIREELEIEQQGSLLRIIKKTYDAGREDPHLDRDRLDLQCHVILPRYIEPDITNLEHRWTITTVVGPDRSRDVTDYSLQGEQDALRFQRFVTGYCASSRYMLVSCSALEQHWIKRASRITVKGELQLWEWAEPKVEAPPLSNPSIRSSADSVASSRFSSIFSTSRGTNIETDLRGKPVAISIAAPQPLLVCFGKGIHGKTEVYKALKIGIADLECEPSLHNARVLKLVHHNKEDFAINQIVSKQEAAWNLCLLSPGVAMGHWQEYSCESFSLAFSDEDQVASFRNNFSEIRARALGLPLPARTNSQAAENPSQRRTSFDDLSSVEFPTTEETGAPPEQIYILRGNETQKSPSVISDEPLPQPHAMSMPQMLARPEPGRSQFLASHPQLQRGVQGSVRSEQPSSLEMTQRQAVSRTSALEREQDLSQDQWINRWAQATSRQFWS